MNFRLGKSKEFKPTPKAKSNYSSELDSVSNNTQFDKKLGVFRAKQLGVITLPQKIKTNANFSVDKTESFNENSNKKGSSTGKKPQKQLKAFDKFKLPQIRRILNIDNPENEPQTTLVKIPQEYYQSKVYRGLKHKENTYLMNLARQHFMQSVEAIKIGKTMKLNHPKQIKLPKKNPKFKTIFLDLDETLIHCDEASTNYTVKLNFPIESGGSIQAGIRVRPHCNQFIKQLANFAQIIIFTASASSYADVVLDYLDPHKKYFSHRLYRNHCTLQRGFFTKDLRIVNRRHQDMAIVDNSAFSFMTQPQFGIPILPFYHFSKDKQLLSLLAYLKRLVEAQDMREKIKQDFFWAKYRKTEQDPRKVLQNHYEKP